MQGRAAVNRIGWREALARAPRSAKILAVECIDQGARTYLVKPVGADFLRLALRDALAMRALPVERNELTLN